MVLPGNASESVPEVRVAAGVASYLRFDAPLDKASLELEGRPARFRWVDVGERLVAVEPSVDLVAEERLVLRVRYKDGASPAVATLVLVSHLSLVDKEVEVVRRPRTVEALETALAENEAELAALKAQCGVGGPAGLVFSGRIDWNGVVARRTEDVPTGIQGGLKVVGGMGYRAGSWALAVVRVRNLPGQQPWAPGSARLIRADGTPVKVLSVEMDKAQLAPGEEGLVAVEPEAPYWKAGQVFRVEVLDKSGVRRVPILDVVL
ncbi:DUF2381 family protein [Archangium violaceum]|uniref:DUF2381 family protein n=1 Tax=Archangium violaceum Cb vi76 TaxID=1406225 RepID=A0A084STF2_9BACT|nr:DUF2381 family protein [Archangium violaceum]KFA91737.1 hypothetical protein Q664_20115 [Archangium violaceum Cb vi76]